MNRRILGPVAGVVFALIFGVGIFFVPEEPLKVQIYIAMTLNAGLIGLMLATLLRGSDRWLVTLVIGAVLGGLMGVTVSLAKGLADAPFAVPHNALEGLVIAAILKKWGRSASV